MARRNNRRNGKADVAKEIMIVGIIKLQHEETVGHSGKIYITKEIPTNTSQHLKLKTRQSNTYLCLNLAIELFLC